MVSFYKNLLLNMKSNVALLVTSIFVGLIVSIVAQLFILSAKNLYQYFYDNPNNYFIINLYDFDLNISSILICTLASLIVCFLIKFKNIDRWHGPADTIYAAHQKKRDT